MVYHRIQDRYASFLAGLCILMMGLPGMAAAEERPQDPNPASIHSTRGAWPLYRQWTPAETQHYATWIEHIFNAKRSNELDLRLAKLERVLTDPKINLLLDPDFLGSPSNPQLETRTMRTMHRVIDCGKLTIALGGYYAYRRGLPWMVSHVRSGDGTDIRSSSYNLPTSTVSSFDYDSAHAFLTDAVYGFCTGNYRIEPDAANAELSDTAPVAVTPEHLVPGTLYYMDGHVMLVGHVDPYGEVHFLDSTTAPTRDIFSYQGLNAANGITAARTEGGSTEFDGCYRGFRVQRYPIAEVDKDGKVIRVRRRTDAEMEAFGYSTEQYLKMEKLIAQGHIAEQGMRLPSFQAWVRTRLRTADAASPRQVLTQFAESAIGLLEERQTHVQAGWENVQTHGGIEFPEQRGLVNIFSAGGRWGEWATAVQDAHLRERFSELASRLDAILMWQESDPDYVELEGLPRPGAVHDAGDLARCLRWAKRRIFEEYTFTYTNSAGEPVELSLADVEERLAGLSFDPNHPPELRWGFAPGSVAATAAPSMPTPLPDGSAVPMDQAYSRQAYYRSLSHRETDESYLRGMFTEGFPVSSDLNGLLLSKMRHRQAPPFAPARY